MQALPVKIYDECDTDKGQMMNMMPMMDRRAAAVPLSCP
jgi:hypothetical protein